MTDDTPLTEEELARVDVLLTERDNAIIGIDDYSTLLRETARIEAQLACFIPRLVAEVRRLRKIEQRCREALREIEERALDVADLGLVDGLNEAAELLEVALEEAERDE